MIGVAVVNGGQDGDAGAEAPSGGDHALPAGGGDGLAAFFGAEGRGEGADDFAVEGSARGGVSG